MSSMQTAGKSALIRDLMIFQVKLVLDGLKDLALIQISLLAAAYDLLFGRPGRPLLFYGVLRLSERLDLWMNLYGAAARAEDTDEGLFGASRAGSNTLLGKLEQIVKKGAPEGTPAVE